MDSRTRWRRYNGLDAVSLPFFRHLQFLGIMSSRTSLLFALACILLTASPVAFAQPVSPTRSPDTAVQDRQIQKEESNKPAPITLPLSAALKRVFDGLPSDVDDLKAMQTHIQKLSHRAISCTVAVRMRGAMGSAVIVSPDGYVLCAGHVIGKPGREITIIMHDGRELKGETLGANYGIDSGLIKITTPGTWPYAELGRSSRVKQGAWCLATGHPGGFQENRSPPLRLGRVLSKERKALMTDCPLVGGDSGGPLFDMQGKVIGIHSRIADDLRVNLHVPVDTYRDTWDRLLASEAWGGVRPGGPVIGVIHDDTVEEARIAVILPDSPAEDAGVQKGDVITSFSGQAITTFRELANAIAEKEPGDRIRIELRRDDKTLELELVLASFGL